MIKISKKVTSLLLTGVTTFTIIPTVVSATESIDAQNTSTTQDTSGYTIADGFDILQVPKESELKTPADGYARFKQGWNKTSDTTWVFANADKTLVRNSWKQIDGKWYHFYANGIMQTGWFRDDDKIYYFNQNGVMQNGWVQDNGKWYYFNQDGSMAVDTTIDGYNIGPDGAWYEPQNNETKTNSKESDIGWKQIDSKLYYFDQSGHMEHNTIVDGYYIGSNGIAVATTTSGDMPIKIPSNWKKVDYGQKIMYAIDNKVPIIYTYTDTFGLSESKFVDGMTAELTKGVTGLSEVQVTEKDYTGKKATCVQFSYKLKSRTIKVRNIIFFKDNKAYCFELASEVADYDNAIQQLDDILNCSLVL